LKKVLKDGTPFTAYLRETFPKYYNKCFVLIQKKPNNDFVFFKYYTEDGKGDDEDCEDSESDDDIEDNDKKDLLLKEIELIFENGYSFADIKEIFPTFYEVNIERINLLFTQVLQERFNRDPTLTIQKNIDIYKSRQDKIETIEKRRTLKKAIRRSERNKEDEEDSNSHSYKRYKTKKDFESVLNNKVQKAKQQRPIKRKFERDDTSDVTGDEEDEEILSK
jgi:hypothetical protein